MEEEKNNFNQQTYMCLAGEDGVNFEVDLVTFREKGQQTKFLAVNFVDTTKAPPNILLTKSFDENSFNEIKKFFKQLDWNG